MILASQAKNVLKTVANVHRPGQDPDIFIFATPRGGSTWLMEIIASQPGFKYYDEPLSPRRENVAYSGVVPDWEALMPDTGDSARIIRFLRDLQAGRHGFMNPPPFRRHHRFLTNRIVFKIHEIEHLIKAVEQECSAQVVYLLRHPIATSLSRHMLPRLEMLLTCSFHAALLDAPGRHAAITALATKATFFQRAIISWCYENLAALRGADPGWLYVTYEELVLNPERSCDLLLQRLSLPDRAAMLEAFDRPAANIRMSHDDTMAALRSPDARRRRQRLATKWMCEVSIEQREQAAEILDLFGIDAYDAEHALAAARFLHFDDTPAILQESEGSR